MNTGKSRFFKIYYFITLLIVFFLPLSKKILPLLIVILFLNWLISLIRSGKSQFRETITNIKYKNLVVLFVSFYVIHLIGLLYSANIDFGLFDLEIKLSILIFPILISTSPSLSPVNVKNILLAFIVGCSVAVFICLSYAIYKYIETGQTHRFAYSYLSVFHHVTYFSMYLNLAIVIIIYFLFKTKSSFSKHHIIFFRFLILLFSLMIILLFAKNGVICLVLILLTAVFYLAFREKKIVQSMLLISGFILLSVCIVKFVPYTASRLNNLINVVIQPAPDTEKNAAESTAVRVLIWPVSLELIKENFLFGVGTGDIKDQLLKKYKDRGLSGALKRRLNAHNQYLQTFAALGLVGFLILTGCLILPFLLSIKEKKHLYSFFLLIIAVNLLTESMLEVQAGVVFYAFFNSFFLFAYNKNDKGLL